MIYCLKNVKTLEVVFMALYLGLGKYIILYVHVRISTYEHGLSGII